MLLAQQTNLLVVIGRIYDTGKGACLKRILKFTSTRKQLAEVTERFEKIETKHAKLIAQVDRLRNNVFAHSSENKALHAAFGFEGLTWDELEAFCRDLISSCDALAVAIFDGKSFGPHLEVTQFDQDLVQATDAWTSLRSPEVAS
jgi:hypothetical protein